MQNGRPIFIILILFAFVFIYLLHGIDIPSTITGNSNVQIENDVEDTNSPVTPEPVGSCFEQFLQRSKQDSLGVGSMPWLDPENVRLLCSVLHNDLSVLEWGCGGSTVYFSRFVKKWRCIEHVPGWGTKILGYLQTQPHRDRVSVVTVEPSEFYDASIPAGSNNDGTYKQFREYIEYPASLGEKFGLIIDDGRARVDAAESALRNKLLEDNGLLIIHDWERIPYHIVLKKGYKIYKEDKKSPRRLVILQPKPPTTNKP